MDSATGRRHGDSRAIDVPPTRGAPCSLTWRLTAACTMSTGHARPQLQQPQQHARVVSRLTAVKELVDLDAVVVGTRRSRSSTRCIQSTMGFWAPDSSALLQHKVSHFASFSSAIGFDSDLDCARVVTAWKCWRWSRQLRAIKSRVRWAWATRDVANIGSDSTHVLAAPPSRGHTPGMQASRLAALVHI